MTTKKLKIGIIGPCPPPHGGVTRILENHLRYWDDLGLPVETWLIATEHIANPQTYPQTRLIALPEKVSPLEFLGAVLRVGWRFGVCGWKSFKTFIAFDISVRKAIRAHRFDVIYAHHSNYTGLVAVTEAHRAGIPAVVQAYGETWLVEKSALRWKRAITYTVRNADWVVATSEHCRQGAISRGADPERTSVVYAGIDLERFRLGLNGASFREAQGIPQDAVVISVLGLALRRKLDTFLAALDSIIELSGVHVLIGGTGDDKAYLEEKVKSYSGRVRALGFVKEKDLPEFYAATDVLVVAPRTLVECMGQSMKEAMSCGRSVAGARLGGVPEALEQGNCGLMFEPDNPLELGAALKRLVEDGALREQLGRNGRAEAEKRFDAKVSARKMHEVLLATYTAAGKDAGR